MMAPFKKSVLTSAIVLAGSAGTQLAMAQASTTSLMLEEVVVTAQKREETVQDVPISITAMSETDLERRGIANVGDLINGIPNMGGYEAPGSRGNVSFSLRGIGSGSPSNLSVDPANAMYLDGVYIGKQIGSALDVAEIQRIEVLRGPQGTLYGRNSTGGAINFITQKPTGEFGGKFTGTAGSDGLWGGKGTLYTGTLGELGEGLGALYGSFGYQKRERDELYDNTNSNFDDFEDMDREGYRIALRWDVNDALTVDYAYDHSELNELATPQFLVGVTPLAVNDGVALSRTDTIRDVYLGQIVPGLQQMNQFAPQLGLSPDDTVGRYAGSNAATLDLLSNPNDGDRPSKGSSDINTFTDSESDGHNLTIALGFDDLGALGSVEFKSITGYREVENRNFGDLDGTDNSLNAQGIGAINDSALGTMVRMYGEELGLFGAMAENPNLIPALTPLYNDVQANIAAFWDGVDEFGGAFFNQDQNFDYEQWSQELQMVGTTDSLEYAVGLYYFSDEGENRNYRLFAQPVGGFTGNNYDNETEAWAIYGQTTWRPDWDMFDDRLAITVGYRYTEEDKEVKYLYESAGSFLLQGPFEGTLRVNPDYDGELAPVDGQYNVSKDQDFDNSSGNLTFAYDVGEASNVFLRYARGYRSGGFNGESFSDQSQFDEETIDMLELGFKSDVIPAVLRVNGSIFAYEYDDQQVSQIQVSESGQTTSFIGNAGKAERWGAEVETQWLPTDDLMISLSYAHMSGDFDEYGTAEGVTRDLDLDDEAKRGSPDNQVSLVTDWVFMRTDWAEFMAHVEVFWQDESYAASVWTGTYNGDPYLFDQIELDDRTLVNARIGIENVEIGNGVLRAALWGRNIFDEDYNTFGVNFASLGPITEQYGEEASFGLDVTYEF